MKIKLILTSLGVIASSAAAVSMTSCKRDDDMLWIKGEHDPRIIRSFIMGYHRSIHSNCSNNNTVPMHYWETWHLDLKDDNSIEVSKSQLEDWGYDTSVSGNYSLETLNAPYYAAKVQGQHVCE